MLSNNSINSFFSWLNFSTFFFLSLSSQPIGRFRLENEYIEQIIVRSINFQAERNVHSEIGQYIKLRCPILRWSPHRYNRRFLMKDWWIMIESDEYNKWIRSFWLALTQTHSHTLRVPLCVCVRVYCYPFDFICYRLKIQLFCVVYTFHFVSHEIICILFGS